MKLLGMLCLAGMMFTLSLAAQGKKTDPRAVLGSIKTRGSVQLEQNGASAEGALFSGGQVQTNNGTASIQYWDGTLVQLGSGSLASFSLDRVRLENGLMNFQAGSANINFSVLTLRLEPTISKTSANITLKDNRTSVAVTEGTLKVVDPSGARLASVSAGEARLFEAVMAPSPLPAPSKKGPWVLGVRRWGPFLVRPTFRRLPD